MKISTKNKIRLVRMGLAASCGVVASKAIRNFLNPIHFRYGFVENLGCRTLEVLIGLAVSEASLYFMVWNAELITETIDKIKSNLSEEEI